MTNEH